MNLLSESKTSYKVPIPNDLILIDASEYRYGRDVFQIGPENKTNQPNDEAPRPEQIPTSPTTQS